MSTLPEQFSAARTAQVETQLNFFQDFTARAIEQTRQLMALNLATTRASVEQSTAAMCHLMSANDPRDLLSLTTQTQARIETMVQYGRALAGIANQASLPQVAAAVAAKVVAKAPPQAELPLETPPTVTPDIAPKVALEVAPAVAPKAAVAPAPATPKPIAKAASTVAAKELAKPVKPSAAPIPAAAKPVVVTSLKAMEAVPAPASAKQAAKAVGKGVAKPVAKGQTAPAAKSKKKKQTG